MSSTDTAFIFSSYQLFKLNTTQPNFKRHSWENKKSCAKNSEMCWMVFTQLGIIVFYLLTAITDSRSAFTAVKWKTGMLQKIWSNCSAHYTVDESQQLMDHSVMILWVWPHYSHYRITEALWQFHPPLIITTLYLLQWFSIWSTILSNLKCENLSLTLIHILSI